MLPLPAASQATHAASGRCHKKAANAASDVPGSSVAEVKAENHSAASREKSDIINGVTGYLKNETKILRKMSFCEAETVF